MPIHALLQVRQQCPTYVQRTVAATNRMLMQFAQGIVCGKRHTIAQQLMRWMLITLALGKLTGMGVIQIHRGEIAVLDRLALEARVCECYWTGQQRQRPTSSAAHIVSGPAHGRVDLNNTLALTR